MMLLLIFLNRFASAARWSGLGHFKDVMHLDFSDGSKFGDISKVNTIFQLLTLLYSHIVIVSKLSSVYIMCLQKKRAQRDIAC